ncbi:hypothetical protein, partial [Rivularia sp. UHCC 0363]|uniref:hypothetical protein n=1 Tax=Rivularia sp. UHCC 0363 TaxID=3110244 RepID=UPI002B1F3BB5
MPSAPKGRYQSRLFNFFHKQSTRFGEGFGRSLRQLQVATSWSIEALSQSIYLLLQKAVDSAGTQLPAAPPEEIPLATDTAIARVLENIETQYIPSSGDWQLSISRTSKANIVVSASSSLSNQPSLQDAQASEHIQDSGLQASEHIQDSGLQASEQDARTTINQPNEQNSPSNLKYSAPKIRGIASQLCSQNLVLVTSENEILDILTASQQQALENKIIIEIANYWRSWRLSQEKPEKLLSKVENILKTLSPDKDNVNQTNALPGVNVNEEYNIQINPSTVASLDTAVAKLENALVPVSRAQAIVRQRSNQLIKVAKAKLDIFLYGDTQNVTSSEYRNITLDTKQVVADGNLESYKSRIQALISAALNYFYGEPKGKKIKQTPPTRYLPTIKPNSKLQSQSTDDWLTFEDLFNSGIPQLNRENQALQLNPSTQVNSSSEKLFGRFQIPNWRTLRLKEKAGLQNPKKPVLRNEQDFIKGSQQDFIKGSQQDFIKGSQQDFIKGSQQDFIKGS